MNTEAMRQRLSRLYAQVFAFLHDAMKWWASRSICKGAFCWKLPLQSFFDTPIAKVSNAFNGSLQDSLQERVSEIRRLSESFRKHVEIAHVAEGRDHRITSEETYNIVRRTDWLAQETHRDIAGLRKDWEDYQKQIEVLKNERNVAVNMVMVLHENFRETMDLVNQMKSQRDKQTLLSQSSLPEDLQARAPLAESSAERWAGSQHFLRIDVLQVSQHLAGHIIGKRTLSGGKTHSTTTDEVIVYRLKEWSGALSPQLLWIIGPPNHALPSNMSSAAMNIISTASKLNVPFVSHFCALPPYERDNNDNSSREMTALTGLVYSLILQLIAQMPPEIKTGIDLAESRFQKLDGSLDNWQEGLDLLADLLQHFSLPLLLCIIDGLSRLDFNDGSPLCGQLIQVLQADVESTTSKTRLKVLLTTSGKSSGQGASLPKMIPENQRLYADKGHGPPGSRNGGSPLAISKQMQMSLYKRDADS